MPILPSIHLLGDESDGSLLHGSGAIAIVTPLFRLERLGSIPGARVTRPGGGIGRRASLRC